MNLPIDLTYAEIRELLLARMERRARKSKPLVIDRISAVADERDDEPDEKEGQRLERLAELNGMELGDPRGARI
jgi:hypothetical protein